MRALTNEERELINGGLSRPVINNLIHKVLDIIFERDHEEDCQGGGGDI